MQTQLNEDDIERRVEIQMDRLDQHYMHELLTTNQYEQQIRDINDWAEQMYSLIPKPIL